MTTAQLFKLSEDREPHTARRRLLLAKHPEIRDLFGFDTRPVLITALVVVAQLAIAAAFQRLADAGSVWSSAWMIALCAYALGAFLNHWGGVVIHEASHDLCAPTTILNRWIAIMANLSTPVPSAMSFRRYHLDHHRHLGVQSMDNDLPTELEVKWLGRSAVLKALWLAIYPFFATFARGFLRKPSRWEIIGFAVQMTANVLVCTLLGWTAMTYLLLSTLFAYGLHPIAGHFLHEHYLWNDEQETYSYYGPLNKLTWNMGYHNEHHDFVRIPGSRLPQLYRIARQTYGVLDSHRSWTSILTRFVLTPRMGHHSRIVRARRPR
jgi:sphingolipid delta-4 desaturase